jgi:hypothetical protein
MNPKGDNTYFEPEAQKRIELFRVLKRALAGVSYVLPKTHLRIEGTPNIAHS